MILDDELVGGAVASIDVLILLHAFKGIDTFSGTRDDVQE